MSDNQVNMHDPKARLDIINALKSNFATTVRRIYVNSLKREVGFREISVQEQKTLARIMIDNDQRKDVMYDAQCSIINKVALDDDFDIYELSEFDKIKLLIALYQTNMTKNEITFTCKECGTENKYKLDFDSVLKRLDDLSLDDRSFDFETALWKFKFTVGYPEVRRVSEFYKSYAAKYRKMNTTEMSKLNNQVNIDYVNMYIKSVILTNKTTDETQTITMTDFLPAEVVEIMSTFPQDVVYADSGVLNYITTELVGKINGSFDKHKCFTCGTEHDGAIDTDTHGFF